MSPLPRTCSCNSENLQTHPAVAVARNELTLHAWIYEIATGEVFAYNAETAQHVPVDELSPSATAPPSRVTHVLSGDALFHRDDAV